MAVDRIATFANSDRLSKSIMKAESKLAEAQTQTSSGLNSTTYSGIADQSSQLVSLKSYLARSQAYSDQGDTVSSKINTMSSAVGDMITTMSNLKKLVTNMQGSGSDAAAGIVSEVGGMMDSLASTMNTTYNGEYVFGGGRTDQKPVDISSSTYTAASYPSSADTSYYQGDDTVQSFRASDSLVIDYGVTADDPSMEKAMRSLNLVANMSTSPVDTNALSEAYDLAQSAIDGLTTIQTKLGANGSSLNDTIDQHLNTQLTLKNQVDNIQNVDLAESSTKLTQLQALLEASTSVMKVMKGFNLSSLL